jgi:hypothetical protein
VLAATFVRLCAGRGLVCARLQRVSAMLAWQILELIHALVETLDRHFDNVCELDIMSQVSLILDPPMKRLADLQKFRTLNY